MRFLDITRPLTKAPVYPTALATVINRVDKISEGCDSNFSLIQTNTHAGTHADAFCHFVDGAEAMEEMELQMYYGLCRVLTFPENAILTRQDFEGKLEGISRICIHGGGYTYLDESAVSYLVECGLKLLVTDAWSPGPLGNEKAIHYPLLSNGVGIVENVVLDGILDGDYLIIAFPAKFDGCDGAPVRAVLITEEQEKMI